MDIVEDLFGDDKEEWNLNKKDDSWIISIKNKQFN